MRPCLPATRHVLGRACLAACTTPPKPISPALAPEYQAALARLVRVPDQHPLLDEGLVPLPVLGLVVAYQDAAKRNRYRDLAPFFRPEPRSDFQQALEDDLLRRETRESPQLAVLTNVARSRAAGGNTGYDFYFTLVKRAQSAERVLRTELRPDGTACITELR
jgi:hypothetical protein